MRNKRYLAPEWISGVAITAKTDVYSYGMMLFELVSGRRNSENSSSEEGKVQFFPSLATRVMVDGGDLLGLVDPVLNRNADEEEVLKICKVASWCIQDDESSRPSMGQVVQILEGLMDVNMPPIPRSHQLFVQSQEEHIIFFTDSSSTGQSSQAQSKNSSASSHPKTTTTSTDQFCKSNNSEDKNTID